MDLTIAKRVAASAAEQGIELTLIPDYTSPRGHGPTAALETTEPTSLQVAFLIGQEVATAQDDGTGDFGDLLWELREDQSLRTTTVF